jgi:lipopolysaccharide transport system permease protein
MLETDLLMAEPHPRFAPRTAETAVVPATPDVLDHLPVQVIHPRSGWIRLNLKELYAYRELLFYLVMRDVTVRYKQTMLGSAWAIVQPVTMMAIFTLVFGVVANIPHGKGPYAVFVFAGLIPWMLFSQGIVKSSVSLTSEERLMSKVYFPRILVPTAASAVFLVDVVISFGLYALLLLYYGIMPSWTVIFVPPLIALTFIATMSLGLVLSCAMVFYHDVKLFVPILAQILLYMTPVVYPLSLVKNRTWCWIMSINPMFGIVPAFRSAILGGEWDFTCLAISSASAVLSCVFAILYFRRLEHLFADFI